MGTREVRKREKGGDYRGFLNKKQHIIQNSKSLKFRIADVPRVPDFRLWTVLKFVSRNVNKNMIKESYRLTDLLKQDYLCCLRLIYATPINSIVLPIYLSSHYSQLFLSHSVKYPTNSLYKHKNVTYV